MRAEWFALAIAVGLPVSFLIERLLRPPPLPLSRRAPAALQVHVLAWLAAFALLTALSGRPLFALIVLSAALLVVVLVSNSKSAALDEPFIFQDYEYFVDTIRFPLLYLPFFGIGKTILLTIVITAALLAGLYLEPPMSRAFALICASACVLALRAAERRLAAASFVPARDLAQLGLLPSLWAYARAERDVPEVPAVPAFDAFRRRAELTPAHVVVVQSESFYDPRPLLDCVQPELLAAFDTIRREAVSHGRVAVPAWGANTVRSEFAFLSGLDDAALGVHRFNPYRKLVYRDLLTLPKLFAARGYRTVCVHPYAASFYRRHRVLPALGFDEFIAEDAFPDAPREGYFIADRAVGDRIRALIGQTEQPLFIFAITMENHGPLDAGRWLPDADTGLYSRPPEPPNPALTRYLYHLRNADRLAGDLRTLLRETALPAWLCWYGDHVPILPGIYREFGRPDGATDFALWTNTPHAARPAVHDIALHELSTLLLSAITHAEANAAQRHSRGSDCDAYRQ